MKPEVLLILQNFSDDPKYVPGSVRREVSNLYIDIVALLPIELGANIISKLQDPKSLASIGCVSKAWRSIADNSETWRRRAGLKGWGLLFRYPVAEMDWKNAFREISTNIKHR